MLRLFQAVGTKKQNRSTLISSYRNYNYLTEIYTKKFESANNNNAALEEEINSLKELRNSEPNLYRFVKAYHQSGHKQGQTNPLKANKSEHFELRPDFYGLQTNDATKYSTKGFLNNSDKSEMTLSEIEAYLQKIYSSEMTMEFEYIQCEKEKQWLAKEFEKIQAERVDIGVKIEILKLLLKSQNFDHFLAKNFPAFKRYSLEGGEASMAFYYSIFSNAAASDIEELVMGIAHRGRLNLMTCMLDLDPVLLLAKIKGNREFAEDEVSYASGDITHHYPCSTDLNFHDKKIHINLVPNPSHLEAVDPLVLGKARSKQMHLKDGYYAAEPSSNCNKVATMLIHGDAAFAGQGIVPETFQLSKLPCYAVGGTIHLLTNNQLGFTNPSNLGHSGEYNTDFAKSINCPIIHVNGDNPELAYKAGQLALKYRNTFAKDVVVDITCFRKYGHNELDEPSFTNPLMYQAIGERQSVPNLYKEKICKQELIIEENVIDHEVENFRTQLDESLEKVNKKNYTIFPRNTYLQKKWSQMSLPSEKSVSSWMTGCDLDFLRFVGKKSVTYPEDFSIHPTVVRGHVNKRVEKLNQGSAIDWATAESMAFGSMLMQGFNIRISGQDVGRGTFSQRHAMFVDQKTQRTFVPLNNIDESQKNYLEICNSNLSEEAVMGFDYGFSLDNPNNLVIWEAQFGDFFNGAQIIIDQYISSGEAKWLHQSGLVLLLPHGFDGAGPEHSSCRIERFLQMSSSKENSVDSDSVNMYIANPTTPANYFHLLRRQMLLPFRKPLICMGPKVLIRLPEAVSSLNDMQADTHFQTVINDPHVRSKESIKRLIFVFGKHYYTLEAEQEKLNANDVAIIRVEEMSPFPADAIRKVVNQYKNATEFVWSQEEHRNMGAWSFAAPRFENILGIKLKYSGREVQACVSGTGSWHAREAKEVANKPFEKL